MPLGKQDNEREPTKLLIAELTLAAIMGSVSGAGAAVVVGLTTGCMTGGADIPTGDAAIIDSARNQVMDMAQCHLEEITAVAGVRVAVHNAAVADRLVATAENSDWEGGFCTSLGMSRDGEESFPLQMGWQCGCECPQPGPVGSRTWHRLRAGETFALGAWDGRTMITCEEQMSCERDWPGHAPVTILVGARRPQPGSPYRVAVACDPPDAPVTVPPNEPLTRSLKPCSGVTAGLPLKARTVGPLL